jgi:tetratricopeptide (TPR) repeat protein
MTIAFEGRGNKYSDLGNAKAALADFDRAIALEPNRASAYLVRGRQKLMGKDLGGALADLDRVIVLNPKEVRAFYGRALVHANAADYRLALADLVKALEIDHRFSPAFTELGIVYLRLGKRDQARDALSTALNLNPNDKTAREALDALAKN